MKNCDNCSKPLGPLPPTALHKRFCSANCRAEFHAKERAQALALLRQRREASSQAPATSED